eukprot:scaffold2266_cov112-Isochrysis_galbana.AAC.2
MPCGAAWQKLLSRRSVLPPTMPQRSTNGESQEQKPPTPKSTVGGTAGPPSGGPAPGCVDRTSMRRAERIQRCSARPLDAVVEQKAATAAARDEPVRPLGVRCRAWPPPDAYARPQCRVRRSTRTSAAAPPDADAPATAAGNALRRRPRLMRRQPKPPIRAADAPRCEEHIGKRACSAQTVKCGGERVESCCRRRVSCVLRCARKESFTQQPRRYTLGPSAYGPARSRAAREQEAGGREARLPCRASPRQPSATDPAHALVVARGGCAGRCKRRTGGYARLF